MTSDNRFIISHSDKSIKVFDFETKQEIHHYENIHEGKEIYISLPITSSDKISSLTITTNNRFIIADFKDGSRKIIDFENEREEVHQLGKGHDGKKSFFNYQELIDH